MTDAAPTTVRAHPWELAGLGRAPFRYVGMYEELFRMPDGSVKAGGSCNYCGQGIRYCFKCVSSDDKSFVVGCDCIARVHSPAERIVGETEKALKDFKRKARAEARAKVHRERAEERRVRIERERAENLAACQADPLYARIKAVVGVATRDGANGFLVDMRDNMERWGGLTEKQKAAVERILERIESEPARKAASQWIGAEGERVTLAATVDFVKCIYRGQWYGDPDKYLVKLRTDDGAAVTWFTASYFEKGQRLTGTAKIRRCEEYNGEKQTVITNPRWK